MLPRPSAIWLLVASILLTAACGSERSAPETTPQGQDPGPHFSRYVIDANPGDSPVEKELADLNGDGRADVIIGTAKGLYWWAFPSSGKPSDPWVRHVIAPDGVFYEDAKAVDVNGDKRIDIIASVDDSLNWYENPGPESNAPWKVHNIIGGKAHDLVLADFDGDGKMDIATSRSHLVLFQNNPDSWTFSSYGGTKDGLSLLDIGSGKGAIDLIARNQDGVAWMENPREHGGDARRDPWIAHVIGPGYSGIDEGPALAAADINGDGREDVIMAPNEGMPEPGTGFVWWEAPAQRTGPWTRHTVDASYQAVHRVATFDVNQDGKTDIVVAEQEQSQQRRVAVFYNRGGGNMQQTVLESTGGHNVTVQDLGKGAGIGILNANHGVFGAAHPVELFIAPGGP